MGFSPSLKQNDAVKCTLNTSRFSQGIYLVAFDIDYFNSFNNYEGYSTNEVIETFDISSNNFFIFEK